LPWSDPIRTGDPTDPGIDGGLSRGRPVEAIVFSMDVTELDPILKEVQDAGGTIVQPKGPIPGIGWFAALRGPDDNVFGLMQEDPAAK